MQLALGIDTGGTYTDAVLVNHDGRRPAGAKALTTSRSVCRHRGATRVVFAVAETQGAPFAPEDVTLVAADYPGDQRAGRRSRWRGLPPARSATIPA